MNRAIYPGSFDPVTLGHLDIIKRASAIFDEVVVGILNNPQKSPLFSVEERVKILEEATADLPNVFIDCFSGMLVDYAKANDINVSIRGLRSISDFEYESQIAQYNDRLSNGKLETIFLVTSPEYSYISSSGVKEVAGFHGDITPYLPEFVADLVKEKYNYS
ncbi:MAG: pantetheine-phosphate adenylyltransferase [Lachnospiraceae bacterium]|nr:pantetheine-phosphate adenylyltransferase [Lachnospiraceae bacterium]